MAENIVLGSGIVVTSTTLHHLANHPRINPSANHGFHHGEMLKVVVGLEEGISSEEFDQDTADTPDVTREAPPQIQDDFGRPIVAG